MNIVFCHFPTSLWKWPYFNSLYFSFILEAVTPWSWEYLLTSVILMSWVSINLFSLFCFYPSVFSLISLLLFYVIYDIIHFSILFTVSKEMVCADKYFIEFVKKYFTANIICYVVFSLLTCSSWFQINHYISIGIMV